MPDSIDQYRELLEFEQRETSRLLFESPRNVIAKRCPACFGPRIGENARELGLADIHVCFDACFQQSRDESAKNDAQGKHPEIFLPTADVERMADEVAGRQQMKKDAKEEEVSLQLTSFGLF